MGGGREDKTTSSSWGMLPSLTPIHLHFRIACLLCLLSLPESSVFPTRSLRNNVEEKKSKLNKQEDKNEQVNGGITFSVYSFTKFLTLVLEELQCQAVLMTWITLENSCSLRDESLLLLALMSSSLARDGTGMLREDGEEGEGEGYKCDWVGERRSLPTEIFTEVENKPWGYNK